MLLFDYQRFIMAPDLPLLFVSTPVASNAFISDVGNSKSLPFALGAPWLINQIGSSLEPSLYLNRNIQSLFLNLKWHNQQKTGI